MSSGSVAQVDDELWSAIGDPTRRRILDLLLSSGEATATSIGEQLPITRQAVTKHLIVLDRAGLVRPTAVGREKRYRVQEAELARAVAQLSAVGSAWDARPRVQYQPTPLLLDPQTATKPHPPVLSSRKRKNGSEPPGSHAPRSSPEARLPVPAPRGSYPVQTAHSRRRPIPSHADAR